MLDQHLEKLRAFHLTAREGSFFRAAQKLGLTQPAVTKAIRALESQIQTSLFVRHSRGVKLTPQGVVLNEFCEALFLRIRDVEHRISNSGKNLSGVLRIGTYETLGELFWPKVLRQIGKDFPDIVVELTTEHPETHWRNLESEALDIIVDAEPRSADQFYSLVLYTDYFGVFCKKNSSLLRGNGSAPISYVRKAVDRHNITIEQHLSRAIKKFDLRYSVESFTMVRSLVVEGVCVGVLPIHLADQFVKNGMLVSFPAGKNLARFGEHRICATCLYDLRAEPRILKITETLKAIASAI